MMSQISQFIIFKNRKFKVLHPPLGTGNFGTVWKVEDDKTKEKYALKIQNYIDEREKQIIDQLSKFTHRNLVNILGFEKINDQRFGILMECCEQDLYERIQKKVFDQKDLRFILVSIADGLKVLHDNNITHRDLKPENIMIKTIVDSRNPKFSQSIYKIADFGLSTNKDINQTFQVGTCYYMAPEVVKNEPYDNKVDVWSLGAISYELLTNRPLFDGQSQNEIFNQIANFDKQENQDLFHKKIGFIQEEEYQTLIKKMLTYNPKDRINIDGVVRELRTRYKSPPKSLPLFQPRIEDPKIKIFHHHINYKEDENNKIQLQQLFFPSRIIPNQGQGNKLQKQNDLTNQQNIQKQAEQGKDVQKQMIDQITNTDKQFQPFIQGSKISTFPLNFQQSKQPMVNQNDDINKQNAQENQMSSIQKQTINPTFSPRSPQGATNFIYYDLKVRSKTPENQLKPQINS